MVAVRGAPSGAPVLRITGLRTRVQLPPLNVSQRLWGSSTDMELKMKKIVPDPPVYPTSLTTIEKPFGTVDSSGIPMFTVRAGIPMQDALDHAATLIQYAEATAWDVVEHLHLNDKALVLGLIQQLDAAQALIGALADRMSPI